MYFYVDLYIKISASCTFFVLLASYGRQVVVQTFVVHTGHPPHNIVHLLHDIMSIFHGLVCRHAASVAQGDLKNSRHMM